MFTHLGEDQVDGGHQIRPTNGSMEEARPFPVTKVPTFGPGRNEDRSASFNQTSNFMFAKTFKCEISEVHRNVVKFQFTRVTKATYHASSAVARLPTQEQVESPQVEQ